MINAYQINVLNCSGEYILRQVDRSFVILKICFFNLLPTSLSSILCDYYVCYFCILKCIYIHRLTVKIVILVKYIMFSFQILRQSNVLSCKLGCQQFIRFLFLYIPKYPHPHSHTISVKLNPITKK